MGNQTTSFDEDAPEVIPEDDTPANPTDGRVIEKNEDGTFTVKWPDGRVYCGELKGWKLEGKGREDRPEGGYYEGTIDERTGIQQRIFEKRTSQTGK